jgi:hypothetical protein
MTDQQETYRIVCHTVFVVPVIEGSIIVRLIVSHHCDLMDVIYKKLSGNYKLQSRN